MKILAPEFAYLEDVRERLIRESRIVSRIDHPNILRIYDADFAGGALYVAMRYVEGPNLKRVLHQQRRFSFDGILVIMSQLASALDAAHATGLFHGNVKPGNVLIAPKKGADGSDFVYLTGFGITRRLERPARMAGNSRAPSTMRLPSGSKTDRSMRGATSTRLGASSWNAWSAGTSRPRSET